MKKEFSGNLSGLKPHERFQLSVKALARGDMTFHKQLIRSCPPEEAVEYLDLLKAAGDCAIHVLLAIHIILAQWEMINALVLQPLDLDSKHVEYFYTTYREHPELSEDTCKVVEGFYSFLAERQAGIKGNNHDFAAKLFEMRSEEMRGEMAEKGYRAVMERYNFESLSDRILAMYGELEDDA